MVQPSQPRQPRPSHWRRPEEGFIKINCDAAWTSTSGQCGLKLIARDHEGSICGGAPFQTQGASVEELEAKTVFERVKLAFLKKWSKVIFESDAKLS